MQDHEVSYYCEWASGIRTWSDKLISLLQDSAVNISTDLPSVSFEEDPKKLARLVGSVAGLQVAAEFDMFWIGEGGMRQLRGVLRFYRIRFIEEPPKAILEVFVDQDGAINVGSLNAHAFRLNLDSATSARCSTQPR